jgi:hypothetical protein
VVTRPRSRTPAALRARARRATKKSEWCLRQAREWKQSTVSPEIRELYVRNLVLLARSYARSARMERNWSRRTA